MKKNIFFALFLALFIYDEITPATPVAQQVKRLKEQRDKLVQQLIAPLTEAYMKLESGPGMVMTLELSELNMLKAQIKSLQFLLSTSAQQELNSLIQNQVLQLQQLANSQAIAQ